MNHSKNRLRVLFLCTGNSCRSQMAEGWARKMHSDKIDAYSAGIEKHGIDPLAVQVMSEAGVDISAHKSKLLDDLDDLDFDYVVTLCDHAQESCPLFPGNAKLTHHGFDDPKTLTESVEPIHVRIVPYRRVRDEIRIFIEELTRTLLPQD